MHVHSWAICQAYAAQPYSFYLKRKCWTRVADMYSSSLALQPDCQLFRIQKLDRVRKMPLDTANIY